MSLKSFALARGTNIQNLSSATPEQLDAIPEGFNNSVRWNVGHVVVIADKVFSLVENYEAVTPSHYKELFDMGTKPADWKIEAPSVEEIVELSKKQINSISQLQESSLKMPLKLYGVSFENVTELLGFITFHEGLHSTTGKLLLKK